jgi:hypothetical protein
LPADESDAEDNEGSEERSTDESVVGAEEEELISSMRGIGRMEGTVVLIGEVGKSTCF